jgi:hypothetical protein
LICHQSTAESVTGHTALILPLQMGGELVMPRAFAWLMLTFMVGSVSLPSADDRGESELAVTIQIHDYWHVSSQSLTRAREIVTAMYGRIGVRTEWMGVVQQREWHPGSPARASTSHVPLAQVTLIILTPTMAARGHVEEGALGFAAVPTEGMGRIAYAIYDRVRDTAARAAMNEDDLLGFVMAHEIAHLMLPRGSHAEGGLMRGHWNVRDFRQTDVLTLEFSPEQASEIRSTLLHNQPTLAVNAGAAGQTAP